MANDTPDPELKETPWGERYRNELESIYGTDLELTEFERAGLDSMKAAVQGQMPDIYQAGRGTIRDVATGGMNVMDSPRYKGLRQQLEREQDQATADVKRLGQAGGMLRSTPTSRAVGETSTKFAGKRLSLLGNLIAEENQRKLRAAGTAAQLGKFESSTLPRMIMQYGSRPREIEAANLRRRSDIAGTMLDYQPWYQPQQTGGGGWGSFGDWIDLAKTGADIYGEFKSWGSKDPTDKINTPKGEKDPNVI